MTSQNFVKLQVWLDEMHAYILIFHDRMITAKCEITWKILLLIIRSQHAGTKVIFMNNEACFMKLNNPFPVKEIKRNT